MRRIVWIILGITVTALAFLYGPARAGRRISPASPSPEAAQPSAVVSRPTASVSDSTPQPPHAEAAQFARGWNDAIAETIAKQVPPEEQRDVCAQVLRSGSHENYARLAAPLLWSDESDPVAMQALWHDLRARPPFISLPVMAEIATQSKHPLSLAAAQTLKLALRENYPDDPGKLRQAVEQFSAVR